LALSRRGWRITYLGTDSPIGAVADTVRSLRLALVSLVSVKPGNFLAHAHEIGELARRPWVVIVGAGATPEVARLTKTGVLDQDPVSAAVIVDRDLPPLGDEQSRL
jgi:MerR family transcriptional regulator, light-induced transcriptional regulator